MKIGICICARVKSTRLPGKVLKFIGNKRTIEILLDHCLIHGKYPVVLAIPENHDDDLLVQIGSKYPIEIYRGQDDSPLHRMNAVANKYDWEYIIRVTADDILIDQELLETMVIWATKEENKYLDYVFMGRCPEGIATEIIKVKTLNQIVEKVGDKAFEFVSYLFKQDGINAKEFYPPVAYQYPCRLTMDYPEDLQLLRIIHSNLAPGFTTLDFINYLKRNKYLLNINKLPRVAVYIPNYNYADHVCDAIESVINQSYRDWELIVIDDCSTDDSAKKIMQQISLLNDEIKRKIKVVVNESNIGLPAVCNKALGMAKGRYIIRLDSDDVFMTNILENMVEKMDKSALQGIFSGYQEIDDNGDEIENQNGYDHHPGCCMLLKSAVNEIKFRDGLKYFEGLDFFKRFDNYYKIETISDVLWKYRRHEGQKTDKKNDAERMKIKKTI